jgi:guanylate kinase|tara:strand:+ start:558 stop:1193 length:636 start_codon:yes stop_codon:yes gene_type:complete
MIFDRTGMMVVISSPSGVGKTTLVNLLSKRNKNFAISISNTTRIPRKDEIEGKDYYFINEEKFNNLIKAKSFYEYARVFDNFYGTLKDPVIKHLSHGKDVLFDIDWQGTQQIKSLKLTNKLISIFILPPNIKTLRDRLSNRDIKDKLILKERMNQFKNDVLHWKEYDYIVINNNLEKCYQAMISIINCEKRGKKFLFDQNKIEKKITELIS